MEPRWKEDWNRTGSGTVARYVGGTGRIDLWVESYHSGPPDMLAVWGESTLEWHWLDIRDGDLLGLSTEGSGLLTNPPDADDLHAINNYLACFVPETGLKPREG